MNRPAPVLERVSWAARMPHASLAAAGPLRLRAVELCLAAEHVWLRGTDVLAEIQPVLAGLSGAELFTIAADGLATPLGARVPSVRLPSGPWTTLAETLAVASPAAVMPGTLPEKVPLRLIRTEREREPNVLVASRDAWRDFALSASALRLRPMKFALSATQAVIWGRPVPSISGTRYNENEGLAVPSGLALAPVSDPEILLPLLGVTAGDLALFSADGAWELIESGLFVPATRSAVRHSFHEAGGDAT